MDKKTFDQIQNYMIKMMGDSAHDALHIYRVLYQSLVISEHYTDVNKDILIASCLLHDIGRDAQFKNPQLCHAVEGGKMAYLYLKELGWDEAFCAHVRDCITTHRFRTDNLPKSLEAKILFDSDKLDVTGALGIARSLIYKGQVGEPLYTVDESNQIQDGQNPHAPESFFKEYHYKLIRLYDMFYTEQAKQIAQKRKEMTICFFEELVEEVTIDDLNKLLGMELKNRAGLRSAGYGKVNEAGRARRETELP